MVFMAQMAVRARAWAWTRVLTESVGVRTLWLLTHHRPMITPNSHAPDCNPLCAVHPHAPTCNTLRLLHADASLFRRFSEVAGIVGGPDGAV